MTDTPVGGSSEPADGSGSFELIPEITSALSPPRRGDVAQALAEIAGAVLALPDVEELLARVADVAAASIGTNSWCGITLRQDRRTFTVATSDARAMRLDELQYADGDGPCMQALRTGAIVSVPDLTTESRWGRYPMQALAEGVRASLSLPLIVDGESVGAVNLYGATVGEFTEIHVRQATVIAAGAAGAVGMALRLARQVELSAQLETALSSRALIDQAIGIVVRDRRCTPDEAFAFLRTASQHRNVKLHTVASELVEVMSRRPTTGGGAPTIQL